MLATAPGLQRIRITVDEGAAYPLHHRRGGKNCCWPMRARRRSGHISAERLPSGIRPRPLTEASAFVDRAGDSPAGICNRTRGEFIEQIGAAARPVRLPDGQVKLRRWSIAYLNVLFHEVQIERLVSLLKEASWRA